MAVPTTLHYVEHHVGGGFSYSRLSPGDGIYDDSVAAMQARVDAFVAPRISEPKALFTDVYDEVKAQDGKATEWLPMRTMEPNGSAAMYNAIYLGGALLVDASLDSSFRSEPHTRKILAQFIRHEHRHADPTRAVYGIVEDLGTRSYTVQGGLGKIGLRATDVFSDIGIPGTFYDEIYADQDALRDGEEFCATHRISGNVTHIMEDGTKGGDIPLQYVTIAPDADPQRLRVEDITLTYSGIMKWTLDSMSDASGVDLFELIRGIGQLPRDESAPLERRLIRTINGLHTDLHKTVRDARLKSIDDAYRLRQKVLRLIEEGGAELVPSNSMETTGPSEEDRVFVSAADVRERYAGMAPSPDGWADGKEVPADGSSLRDGMYPTSEETVDEPQ